MSRRKPLTPLHLSRRKVAKELNLPEDDWRVIRLSTYMCAHEAIQAQLANGETIDVPYLREIDQAIEDLRGKVIPSSSDEPPFILKICSKKLHSVCERCGHIQPTDIDVPPPDHLKPKPSREPPPFVPPLLLPAPVDDGGSDV
jgi:hypothetical protein